MENGVKQRIRDLLLKMGSNPTQLARKYSLNQKTLNNQINSDVQLSASTILLVLSEFDNVSSEWLLRGKGDMLFNKEEGVPVAEKFDAEVEVRNGVITIKRK